MKEKDCKRRKYIKSRNIYTVTEKGRKSDNGMK